MSGYKILQGDVLQRLKELPDQSVHMVCTSPPYWGLRDYGTPAQVWGGDPECDHEWGKTMRTPWANNLPGPNGRKLNSDAARQRPKETGPFCQKCYAWRGSLGLEPTPELFVRNLVLVFREVWRVLRPDGVCFVNLGDSYAGSWGNYAPTGKGGQRAKVTERFDRRAYSDKDSWRPPTSFRHPDLKPKDLVGMPWRVAFALQSEGWYLRSDIIWSKPNPMPESVTDRPAKSHEYVFMLTKRKRYFYDNEAVKEPVTGNTHARGHGVNPKAKTPGANGRIYQDRDPRHPQDRKIRQNESFSAATKDLVDVRNKRSVWTIATKPNPDPHYATFPPELPKTCIKAGTSERGCCAKCGAPWVRVIKRRKTGKRQLMTAGWNTGPGAHGSFHPNGREKGKADAAVMVTETLGWRASCKCEVPSDPVDCVVLDPFSGDGTTGVAALLLGRSYIGIELNPVDCERSEQKLREAERQAYGNLFLPMVKEIEQATLFQLVDGE